jgi:hypothetical protein
LFHQAEGDHIHHAQNTVIILIIDDP